MTVSDSSRIDAVVLAGGLGTRLQSVVSDRPKPMAEVGGKPFLDLVLRNLRGVPSLDTVVLALSHMAGKIVDAYRCRSDFGFCVDFSIEDHPLGTGGAIRWALPKTKGGTIVVTNGDSFVEVDWERLLETHRTRCADLTVVLREVDDAGRYGRVETDDSGRVLDFREKEDAGAPGWINAGVYVMSRRIVESLPLDVPASFEREVVPALLLFGQVVIGFPTTGRFIDIGLPETYKAADEYLKDHLEKGEVQ